MTREECEKKLQEHWEEMVAILHQYSPGSTYFTASWSENEQASHFNITNECFNPESPDSATPIFCHKFGGREWVSCNY